MMQKLLEIHHLTVSLAQTLLLDNINLIINQGEQWAITGGSGSGKTTLAQVINGQRQARGEVIFHPVNGKPVKPLFVEQHHHFKNLSNTNDLYYQQRFNSQDAGDTITVADALKDHPDHTDWITALHLDGLLNKPLIQLSNGENKRLQLAKALMTDPAFLILDNPFIGLDAEGRNTLNSILGFICKSGLHILLITTPGELPSAITHVAILESGRIIRSGIKEHHSEFQPDRSDARNKSTPAQERAEAADHFDLTDIPVPVHDHFQYAVKMENVSIRYGTKTVLHNINWEVRRGEAWSLSGHNGAGKSTLLSLITGDNPQAYSQLIYLFDKRRGSGESIWDIKEKIGYISPELHLHFDQSVNCFDVIASGLFDTIGLFRKLSLKDQHKVMQWMKLMELEELKSTSLRQLPSGRQRMVLLARALVKNPPLLILDEPFQGLDESQIAYMRSFISQIHNKFGTTLICVSHYEQEMPDCVNHFLRLEQGRATQYN